MLYNIKGNVLIIILISLFLTGVLVGQFLDFTDWSTKQQDSAIYVTQTKGQDSDILSTLSNYLSERSFCSRSLQESGLKLTFDSNNKLLNIDHDEIKLLGQTEEDWKTFIVKKGEKFGKAEIVKLDFPDNQSAVRNPSSKSTQIILDIDIKKDNQIHTESFTLKVSLAKQGDKDNVYKAVSCYGVGGQSSCPDGNIIFKQDKEEIKCSNDLKYNIAMYHYERVMPCYEVTGSFPIFEPYKDPTSVSSEELLKIKSPFGAPCATMVNNVSGDYKINNNKGSLRPVTQAKPYVYGSVSGVSQLRNFAGFKNQGHLVDRLTYRPKFSGKLDVKTYVPVLFYKGNPEHAFSGNLFIRENCSATDSSCDLEVKQIGVADICNPFTLYRADQKNAMGCWGLVWGDYEVQKGKTYDIFLTVGSKVDPTYELLAGTVKMSTIYMEGVWDITEYTGPIESD